MFLNSTITIKKKFWPEQNRQNKLLFLTGRQSKLFLDEFNLLHGQLEKIQRNIRAGKQENLLRGYFEFMQRYFY